MKKKHKNNFQLIILQACMQNPKKLFEKFTHDVNRSTQKEAWEDVAKFIAESGIYVKNISSLRQNINNWTRRAIVSQKSIHLLSNFQ